MNNKSEIDKKTFSDFKYNNFWAILAIVILVSIYFAFTQLSIKEVVKKQNTSELKYAKINDLPSTLKEDDKVANNSATLRIDFNCSDFSSQKEAQRVFDGNIKDIFGLDRDNDGIACESLL